VIIDLGNGISMSVMPLATETITFYYPPQRLRGILRHPGKKIGAKIEVYELVIIDNIYYVALIIKHSRSAVWGITLICDPFIPIVIGKGGILNFDGLQPRILPGRLVKVPMYADEMLRGAFFHLGPDRLLLSMRSLWEG
jgi:hypothetical protein